MMKHLSRSSRYTYLLAVSGLLFLIGCSPREWFEKQQCSACGSCHGHDEQQALVTVSGESLVTKEHFYERMKRYFQVQPQLFAAFEQSGKDDYIKFFRQALDSSIAEQLLQDVVRRNKWDIDTAFSQERHMAHELLDAQLYSSLLQQHIMQEIESEITREAVIDFYEQQKDSLAVFQRDPFLISPKSAKIVYVSDLSESEAASLLSAAQAVHDLRAAATRMAKKVSTQDAVSQHSFSLPLALRTAALQNMHNTDMSVVPLHEGHNAFAVVQVLSRKAPVYKDIQDPVVYAAVKDIVVRQGITQRMQQLIETERNTRTVVINDELLIEVADYIRQQGHRTV